jgi:hypothetical protein
MATLYVNAATGDDNRSYATVQNSGTPWATIGRAVWGHAVRSTPNQSVAAQSGDTVVVAAGSYSSVLDNSGQSFGAGEYTVLWNPVNPGVTVQASGAVVLEAPDWGGPLIGADAIDGITWIGDFRIDEATSPRTVSISSTAIHNCDGCVLDGVVVDGNDGTDADNHTGCFVASATNYTIRNCTIFSVHNEGWQTPGGNQRMNSAGILVYGSRGGLMEHNRIYDCGAGIFMKAIGDVTAYGPDDDTTQYIRYNDIYECHYGVVGHRHVHTTSTAYVLVYGNTVWGNPVGSFVSSVGNGLCLLLWGENDGPSNYRFFNNTIHDIEVGFYLRANSPLTTDANCLFQNNIVSEVDTYAIYSEYTGDNFTAAKLLLDRNFYHSYGTNFVLDGATARSFGGFKTQHPDQDVNSLDGTSPLFVDGAGRDYRLQGGSTALTAGRVVHSIGGTNGDTIPAGAYITGTEVIGPTVSQPLPHIGVVFLM